jgi:hypothetical protein
MKFQISVIFLIKKKYDLKVTKRIATLTYIRLLRNHLFMETHEY